MERELFDGTCPNCAGDKLASVNEIKQSGKMVGEIIRCTECQTLFQVSEQKALVVEYEPKG
jgi:hypothetical protein